MQKLIILRGYPGSGKTTVGKHLENKNVKFIDHNALLTFIAKTTENDDGIYEELHSLEKSMAKKLLYNGKSVMVARGFTSRIRLDKYTSISNELGIKSYIITLEAPKSALAKRVVSPERKDEFNPTVTEKALSLWIEKNPIEPVSGERLIDSTQSVDVVIEDIKQFADL